MRLYALYLQMTQVRRWLNLVARSVFCGLTLSASLLLSTSTAFQSGPCDQDEDGDGLKEAEKQWQEGMSFFCGRACPFLLTLGTCGDEQFSTMVTKMRGMSILWVVMAMPEKNGGLVQLVLWDDGKMEMSFWWLEVLVVGLSVCYQGYPLLMPCKPTRGGQKNPSPILWLDSEPEKEKG